MQLRKIYYPVIFCLAACGQPEKQNTVSKDKTEPPVATTPAIADSLLIIPGERIGKIRLGEKADSVIGLLGRPDTGDAAMGSSLMTWYAGHDTSDDKISIFSQHNYDSDDEVTAFIKKIRVTSPAFKTAGGLGTGLTFQIYKGQYLLVKQRSYKKRNATICVYNDTKKGIAFEIDSLTKKAVAITIYKPGSTSIAYINMDEL